MSPAAVGVVCYIAGISTCVLAAWVGAHLARCEPPTPAQARELNDVAESAELEEFHHGVGSIGHPPTPQ